MLVLATSAISVRPSLCADHVSVLERFENNANTSSSADDNTPVDPVVPDVVPPMLLLILSSTDTPENSNAAPAF